MTLYEILGVPEDADSSTIKKAFRKKAHETHPDRRDDKAKAEDEFKDVQRAYMVLLDPDKRKYYDETKDAEKSASPEAGKITIQSVLTNAYITVVGIVIDNYQDPRYVNMMELMRQVLSQQITNLKDDIQNAARGQGILETTIHRTTDPEGILIQILEDELTQTKEGIKKKEETIDTTNHALKYIHKCKYRVDPSPTSNWRDGYSR